MIENNHVFMLGRALKATQDFESRFTTQKLPPTADSFELEGVRDEVTCHSG